MNRAVADCFAHQCHLIYSSSSAQCVWAQTGTTGISPLIKTSFTALYCRALVIHCCRFTASASYSPPLRWKAFHLFFLFFSDYWYWFLSLMHLYPQGVCRRATKFWSPMLFCVLHFLWGYTNHKCLLCVRLGNFQLPDRSHFEHAIMPV